MFYWWVVQTLRCTVFKKGAQAFRLPLSPPKTLKDKIRVPRLREQQALLVTDFDPAFVEEVAASFVNKRSVGLIRCRKLSWKTLARGSTITFEPFYEALNGRVRVPNEWKVAFPAKLNNSGKRFDLSDYRMVMKNSALAKLHTACLTKRDTFL